MAITMQSAHAILLISDRPDDSRVLAKRLDRLCACQMVELDDWEGATGAATAVIADIEFCRPVNLERVRRLFPGLRASALPILGILRNDNHLERVQAAAAGTTYLFPASVSVHTIYSVLAPCVRSMISPTAPASLATQQKIEQARIQFGAIFDAATQGGRIGRSQAENATASVIDAVAEGGIRQWLEVVWTYDDLTYQHCLLVTGLATEFALTLNFSESDCTRLVKAALLHDVGKARIPLGILTKPAALTRDEMDIMHTHVRIGYELLRDQGDYDPEILEVVLRHHEMLDGSGYPDGLVGSQIPDLVRLVTICDVYAALIERRSYKKPLEPKRAFKIIEEMIGKLEGALVRAFALVAELSAAGERI
jgi:putative nucleotidyltransferase with HDIG domain